VGWFDGVADGVGEASVDGPEVEASRRRWLKAAMVASTS